MVTYGSKSIDEYYIILIYKYKLSEFLRRSLIFIIQGFWTIVFTFISVETLSIQQCCIDNVSTDIKMKTIVQKP